MTQDKTQRLDQIETPVVNEPKHGILSKVSRATALAAALTAIVALLFSSRLGITGSLIGAAVGALVSTVASRFYGSMVDQSVNRYQADLPVDEPETTQDLSGIDNTAIRPLPPELQEERDATMSLTGTPVAPEVLREEAEKRHRASLMKWSFAVTVLAALIALGIYALVVSVATQGQGIGPKPTVRPSIQQPVEEEAAQTEATEETDAAATETETAPEDEAATETPQDETQAAPETQVPEAQDDQSATPVEPSPSETPADTQPSDGTPADGGDAGGGEAAPSEPATDGGESAEPAPEG